MRPLFLRELRDSLIPSLIAVVMALGVCFLAERIYAARNGSASNEAADILNTMLIVGIFLSGFVSGERAFSIDLRDRRLLFLSVLPIRRSAIWISIAAARLLALAISLASISMARPSLLSLMSNLTGIHLASVIWPIALVAVPFASGMAFALSVGRIFYTYAVGVAFLLVTYFEAVSYSQNILFLGMCLALLASGLIGLSLYFFKRGETGDLKLRLKNNLWLFAWISVWWALTWNLSRSPDILFSSPFFISEDLTSVSRDGRYLCVVSTNIVQSSRSVISVVDTSTGKILGRKTSDGVFFVQWAEAGNVVEILAHKRSWLDPLGLLFPEGTAWTRISHTARILASSDFPEELAVGSVNSGDIILVVGTKSASDVLYLEGHSGKFARIAQGPPVTSAQVRVGGQGEAFVGLDGSSPETAWLIHGQSALALPPSPVPYFAPSIIFGKIVHSNREARKELEEMYLPPSEAKGGILLPSGSPFILKDQRQSGIFFLEVGIGEGHPFLWARNGLPGPWRRLSEVPQKVVGKDSDDLEQLLGRYWNLGEKIGVDFDYGIAAYITADSDEVSLYDPSLEHSVKGPACSSTRPSSIRVYKLQDSEGVFVKIACQPQDKKRRKILGFQYKPGTGEIKKAVEWTESNPVEDESPIHFGRDGSSFWLRNFNRAGVWQEIWHISPTGVALRIWPPVKTGFSSSLNPADT